MNRTHHSTKRAATYRSAMIVAAVALVFGLALGVASSASASAVHRFLYQLNFAGNNPGTGGAKAFGVAVDNSSGSSAGDAYVSHGAAAEQQTVTVSGSPSGGTFTLTFESCTTSGIPASASAAEVQSALRALSCIGSGNVTVGKTGTATGAVYSVNFFGGIFQEKNVPQMSCDGSNLSGGTAPTCTVETTQAGTPVAIGKFSPSSSSASFLCQITGRGELALESSAECDTSAPGPGALQGPRGVAVDPSSGLTYVIDAVAHRVYQFESDGKYTGRSLDLGTASALRLDVSAATGNVFIADETDKRITEWDPTTETTKTFATEAGSPLAAFGSVDAVAVDNDPTSPNYEDVYVADSAKNVVDRFSSSGTYQCQITGEGSASTSSSECSKAKPGDTEGELSGIGALAVDPANGHLYVADQRLVFLETNFGSGFFSRPFVDEYTATGDYLASINYKELEAEAGGNIPFALAVSGSTGDLFEASANNPGEVWVFGPDAPIVTTDKPSGVTSTTATLKGTVNPISAEVTSCRFEYLEAASYEPEASEPFAGAQTASCETEGGEPIGAGTSPVSVHADVTLKAGSGYIYRLEAENARTFSTGETIVFGPPAAKTDAATEIAQSSATLNGTIEPENVATTYQFEYGDPGGGSGEYDHTAPASPASAGSGEGEVQVSQSLSGLQVGATYHYRVTAQSASGTFHGTDRIFTALPAALIDAQPAASIGSESAILQAYVNPLGSATTYHFEWGTKAEFEAGNYGHSTPPAAAGAGSEPTLAEAKVEGLQPQAEYHFRLVAENANGTVKGSDEPLTTEPAPGSCPNEARRVEQGKDALRLPECRAFEQVTPEEKDAAQAEENSVSLSASGERVKFESRGIFAGTQSNPFAFDDYISERGPDGWHTVGIQPNPEAFGASRVYTDPVNHDVFSPDLSRAFFDADYGSGHNPIYTRKSFFMREPDGSFVQASPMIENLGHTRVGMGSLAPDEDLSKLIFQSNEPLAPDSLVPTAYRLYEIENFGTPSAALRLVNVDAEEPGGIEPCEAGNLSFQGAFQTVGSPGLTPNPFGSGRTYAVSSNGSHVFFTTRTHADHCHWEVFARINGSETQEISRLDPNEQCTTTACLIAPVSDSAFASASSTSERAYFVTGGQLTDEATQFNPAKPLWQDTSTNLYLYDFSRPVGHRLVDVSAGDASGGGPRVQTMEDLSKDGSRAYFMARGVLTGQPNALGQTARDGADNVYVYDAETEKTSFIADVCDGEEKTGTITGYAQCAGAEGNGDEIGRVGAGQGGRTSGGSDAISVTPDGHYFFFATHAKVTPDDQNEAEDVYRYDAVTGSLARITVGHDREDQNGNGGGFPALMETYNGGGMPGEQGFGEEYDGRRVTADGQSALIFTVRPLQAGDENGKLDLYLWHQGQVSRITSGRSIVFQRDGVISSSGNDIVFSTPDELLSSDKDGLRDVYDARVGGGFAPEIPPPVCEGAETCHGEGTHEGAPPNVTHIEGESNRLYCHKGFVKRNGKCVKKKKHHKHKKHRKHGRRNARTANPTRGGAK